MFSKAIPRLRSFTTEVIKEPRLPKKKVALLVGFNGSKYQGMQINPNAYTVETVLFDALCKTGAVSKLNSIDASKVQLQRAARTDKGVHASSNLISLKMICEDPDLVKNLNSVLPEEIRVWGYVDTQRSFHAKTKCDSRQYEYLFPTYALEQLEKKELKEARGSESDVVVRKPGGSKEYFVTPTSQLKLLHYRIDSPRLNRFKELMSLFKGTHNFHNYTLGKSDKDRSARRHLFDIQVGDPFVINGMEWVSVQLHGQSFMLHQIRKMMSMGIISVRTNTSSNLLLQSFQPPKINIPKAPALGLLLDRPVFHHYNNQMKELKAHPPIDFSIYEDEINEFKERKIYTHIFNQEIRNHEFDTFLISTDAYLDSEFSYFNSEGIIPEHCIKDST
ncbi:pseudouridine synthase [Pilobolus umbonatus]|nr:pseudouridine synthase [Pilobolus umbonatus]